jgi:hypothetical protein
MTKNPVTGSLSSCLTGGSMNRSFGKVYLVGSNPGSIEASCISGKRLWILALATVLSMLFLGHGFGDEWVSPWERQPNQIRSQVNYDPNLSDPLFKTGA